jgi:hypothetical protein
VSGSGAGSVAFGSKGGGIGSGASTFICEGPGFFAFNSATIIGSASATGTWTIPFALSTQPAELSFS